MWMSVDDVHICYEVIAGFKILRLFAVVEI